VGTMDFNRLRSTAFSRSTVNESAEEKYWKRFRPATGGGAKASSLSFSSPVTAVSFSGAPGFDFAVTSGTRVCIYDGRTAELKRSLARFKDIAYGASFRHDGRLVAGGCKNSHVYIFDGIKGNLMRMLKGHKSAVQCTAWAPTGSFLLSCSDDKTARYWDVSTEETVTVFRGHGDQVRTSHFLGDMPGMGESVWATGSYDHTVRLWDVRAPAGSGSIMEFQLDGPVEAVLGQAISRTVLGAAGNVVKVFDVAAGGKVRKEMRDHQKTVTTLFMDGTQTRILSGSLDGLLKVCDANTYECTASVVVGSGQGILSAALSKNNSTLLVGCVSGEAIVRKRITGSGAVLEDGLPGSSGLARRRKKDNDDDDDFADVHFAPRGGTKRFFLRGGNVGPAPGDFKVAAKRSSRLAAYDVHLKKFNYKRALDEVLKSRQPPLVASLLEELQNRNGLEAALAGRDDAALEPLLAFLVRFVTNPRFAPVLIQVCEVVLNLYAGQLGQSVMVDELFVKLSQQLREEVRLQKELVKVSGTLDLVLSAAAH